MNLHEALQLAGDRYSCIALSRFRKGKWLFTDQLLSPLCGFVAQIGLRSCFPFPRTDLACGYGTGYAKSCEAV